MLKTVRLELARNPGFPEGSSKHGYELVVPLDGDGHVDLEQWRKHRAHCRARRFWEGEDDQQGELIHKRGGWAVSYEPGDEDDEAIFRLDSHTFRVGEYVSITERDGSTMTFKVAGIR